MRTVHKLLLICLGALGLRLALLPLIHNPGLHDPLHYYNLGRRLLEGQGFTIDYVWHYNIVHTQIVHPIDHWMPLSGLLTAVGMALGGVSPQGALLLFLLMGALLPALVYVWARQMACSERAALFAAAFAAVLPEFVLNALRTDTTLPQMLLVTAAMILLTRGLQRGGWWPWAASGALMGLAYLNRNDAALLLPMLVLTLALYWRWGPQRRFLRGALLVPLAAALVVAPWIARNLNELGVAGTPETGRMFFFTDQRQHYAYDTEISLATMLEQQTPGELIGKRLFELLAAVKQMATALDVFLPVALAGGLMLLLAARDRQRLLTLAPVLILLLGILAAYPLLIPYKSQSGSFKKAYLTLAPLLLPAAAWAVERVVSERRLQVGVVALAALLMAANAYDLVRQETAFADDYFGFISELVETAQSLPDVSGDGEIRLMTEDPYVLSYYGLSSVMTPWATRQATLEVVALYEIDYVMLPTARPALDSLYGGQESDPHFVLATTLSKGNRIYELYAIHPPGR